MSIERYRMDDPLNEGVRWVVSESDYDALRLRLHEALVLLARHWEMCPEKWDTIERLRG